MNVPLFDKAHLEAQTAGDAALAAELLGLFREQCGALAPGLANERLEPELRADLAHTLKGSALGIGAMRLAGRAGILEEALRAGAGAPAAEATRALADDLAATLAAIAE